MDSAESRRQNQAVLISAHQISQILERALPNFVLESYDLLSGGLVNLSYRLRLAGTEAPLVLRIYTRDPSDCEKEIRLLRSLAKQIPVPDVIYANPDGDGEVGPHLLYRYIEGMTFQELKAQGNLQDVAGAAYAIGAALARVQTVSPMRTDSASPVVFPGAAAGDCVNSPIIEQRLGGVQRDRLGDFVLRWLLQIRSLYQDRNLVHGDFNNRNTLVKREAGGWVVTGILDWERAFSGSPLWDTARFICFERRAHPRREPHFSRGYCENGGSLPKDWSALSRAINVVTATESLSRPDLPERFVPDLCDLVVSTLDGRDPS